MYKAWWAIKVQTLANFIVELTRPKVDLLIGKGWTLYVEGFLKKKRNRVRVILEGPNDIILEYSLRFSFKATNN